ncbi:STAS domain-containing protein [Nonomuraea sp. NPDC004186]
MERGKRGGNLAPNIRSLPQSCRPLRVTTQASDGVTVMEIAGELDLATAEPLSTLVNAVVADACSQLVLDLSGISFCDMSGLRALRICGETAHASGVALELIGLPDRVLRLLTISGLMPVFAPVISAESRSTDRGLSISSRAPVDEVRRVHLAPSSATQPDPSGSGSGIHIVPCLGGSARIEPVPSKWWQSLVALLVNPGNGTRVRSSRTGNTTDCNTSIRYVIEADGVMCEPMIVAALLIVDRIALRDCQGLSKAHS